MFKKDQNSGFLNCFGLFFVTVVGIFFSFSTLLCLTKNYYWFFFSFIFITEGFSFSKINCKFWKNSLSKIEFKNFKSRNYNQRVSELDYSLNKGKDGVLNLIKLVLRCFSTQIAVACFLSASVKPYLMMRLGLMLFGILAMSDSRDNGMEYAYVCAWLKMRIDPRSNFIL